MRNLAILYLGTFLLNYSWYFMNDMLLFQARPQYFLNQLDITGNFLMLSGMQHDLLKGGDERLLMDALYLFMPIILVAFSVRKSIWRTLMAIFTALFMMCYAWFYSISTFVSIEVFTAWMLMPLVFAGRNANQDKQLFDSIRLIFAIIFLSTALWKIRAGGIFNTEQMSAILLQQHASAIIDGNAGYIQWLIRHPGVSYYLYLAAFLVELAFGVALFTRKYDRMLAFAFCCFILFNYVLMNISYFSWLPFAGLLFFKPVEEHLD